jgi:hypothetical protein
MFGYLRKNPLRALSDYPFTYLIATSMGIAGIDNFTVLLCLQISDYGHFKLNLGQHFLLPFHRLISAEFLRAAYLGTLSVRFVHLCRTSDSHVLVGARRGVTIIVKAFQDS